MTANELRSKYLDFFKQKGHTIIPSASLIPENDPTVLFTTAGMHPLVPFLLGEAHPGGKRIVSCQRCIRTGDIDLVGDDTHLTFFEMLGNWSFGDYWKQETIAWSWEFLTSKEWLGLDPSKIYVTCFAGDDDAPKDVESAKAWSAVGVPNERIAFLAKKDNWWGPAGTTGPCGPDTEMFYQVNTDEDDRPGNTNWPKGKYVEIWNDVFMEYLLTADGRFEPLKQKNVDTGMGVERTLAVVNGQASVFTTELFAPLLATIRNATTVYDEESARVIVDHLKAAAFLLADGVRPSNKEQGYILRRLIRKAIRESQKLNVSIEVLDVILVAIQDLYVEAYPHLLDMAIIVDEFATERDKFLATLHKGNRFLEKEVARVKHEPDRAGQFAFDLYQTYGFPPEVTFEILTKEKGIDLKSNAFAALYREYLKKHQELSRKGAEQKFSGGLADHSERVVRMHTATHLLHQALRDVLGSHVAQKGSNITAERLRFDFTNPEKVSKEKLQRVEAIVNQKIQEAIAVEKKILPIEEARKLGATGLFGEKYGETVSVYLIGDYSREFCGGPHVTNTKEIGHFKILKEEAVSAGIRRIKATVG